MLLYRIHIALEVFRMHDELHTNSKHARCTANDVQARLARTPWTRQRRAFQWYDPAPICAAARHTRRSSLTSVYVHNDPTAKGTYVMTCGQDKTVRLWNPHRDGLETKGDALLVKTYEGRHGYDVQDVAMYG